MSASSHSEPPSTLAVVPLVGRVAMASERLGDNSLVGLAVSVAVAAWPRVLVVSPVADRWATPPAVEWLTPQSDADFVDAIAPFDRVVVHDLLCPTTSADLLRDVAAVGGPATAAVSALVDTVKAMDADRVAHTVDRDRLVVVGSPVAVDRRVLVRVPHVVEALHDLAVLVDRLRAITTVTLATLPAGVRRVSDPDDLRVLAARPS